MKQRKVWRYTCDFCKKSGCSAYHIREHEKHCTANPNRSCAMHHNTGEAELPVHQLVTTLRLRGLDALRDSASGCPVCMFAAIRQAGMHRGYADEEGYTPPTVEFNLKKELASFWASVNDAKSQGKYDY